MDRKHIHLPKRILEILLVLTGLLSQSHAFANAEFTFTFITDTVVTATLTSDQTDYPPGATAYFTGSGFSPGESVIMQVLHFDGHTNEGENHGTWTVTADENGNFETSWHVCEDDCEGSTLVAVADGQTSGLHAQTAFTDAVLTVTISGPANICAGTTASFTSNPSAGGGTYQWRKDGFNIIGATTTGYVASTAGTYDLVYTKSGVSATSNAIVLTITTPALFSVTGGGAYCVGGSGVLVGLSGSETGVNYQLKLNGTNSGSPVAGSGFALSFGNQLSAGAYTVVGCATTMTGNALVSVNSRPSASITSSNTSICKGSSTNLTGTITATGNWTMTLNGDGQITGSGSGTFSKSLSPISNTTYTIATLTDAACSSATSDLSGSTAVTVNDRPTATITSPDKDLCIGSSTNITGSVTASGHWTLSLNGDGSVSGNGTGTFSKSVTPTSTTTYTIGTLADNKCSAISADLSGSTTITVLQLPVAVAAPSSQTICSGEAITSIVLSGAGTYSWTRNNVANVTGIAASGTGDISGTLTNITTTVRTVTFTITPLLSGCTGEAITATVTVNPSPAVTTQPVIQSVTYGTEASFSVAAAGMITGYQWQEYAGTSWSNITDGGIYSGSSTTTLSLSLPGVSMNNYKYRCVVTGFCDPVATSNAAALTVTARPITITVDPGQTKVYGQSDPANFSYQITSGTLVTGDTLNGSLNRTGGEDVNIYAINQNTLTGGINYLITFISDNFSITRLGITGDFTASNKVYNGNTDAAILTRTLVGSLSGDDVALSGGTASFDNKNVGNGKVVTASGMNLSGTKATNYNLLSVDTASANITAAAVSVTPTATGKTYGASDPSFSGTLSGFITGDGISAVYSRTSGETVAGSPYTISAVLSPDSALSNYSITYNTANFTITAAAVSSALTFSANPQQYSDPETFTLTIPGGAPLISGGPQAAESATFSIGTQELGTANLVVSGSDLVASLSNVALMEPAPFGTAPAGQMLPGAHTVKAVINNPDSNYSFNTLQPAATLNIIKENAGVYYTGGEFASTGTATATSANIRLSATVVDTADGHRGDIRNAMVRFKIQTYNCDINMTPGAIIYTRWRTVSLINASDNTRGTAVLDTALNIGSCDAKIYDITAEAGNYYTGNSGPSTVTIAKSINDFITGGGHFDVGSGTGNKTSGVYKSTDDSKTNWGFNVKYNKNRTNLQGNINVIIRSAGKSYQIKGIVGGTNGALSVNSTDPSNMRATLTAKANIVDLSTGLAVNFGSNATIELKMNDKGEPGANRDTYAVTVWGSNSSLLYSSNWTGSSTAELPINGGNIQVKSSSSSTRSMEESDSAEVTGIDDSGLDKPLIIYPNPNTGHFTVEVCKKEINESAQIEVTNSVGQLVYSRTPQVLDGCIREVIELDKSLPDGIYFLHLKIGQKDQMTKMMLMR